MIRNIKNWINQRLLARKLHKSGFRNWEAYHRWYDADVSRQASRVEDFYCGYPYVYCFENRSHHAYSTIYDYGPGGHSVGVNDIKEWCVQNIKDKIRFDYHRVYKFQDNWRFDEMGGEDYIFVAFKSERDYLWFLMKWS